VFSFFYLVSFSLGMQAGRLLLAASTHLYWHPAHPDIKTAQAHLLCTAMREFAERHGAATRWGLGKLPLVVGGVSQTCK